MTAENVKKLLPFVEAFANKRPLFVRRNGLTDWARINPDSTEFRFKDLDSDEFEWSLKGTEA